MKERPIIFSAEMVRAIRDGRKTQTRRVIKPQPIINKHNRVVYWNEETRKVMNEELGEPVGEWRSIANLFGKYRVGDRLWVKETHALGANGVFFPDSYDGTVHIAWTSARFMKKIYARIWLEITNIGVERVQDIDAVEVEAEGIRRPKRLCPDMHDEYILLRFQRLWDSLNAKRGYGWDKNPWVWVVDFRQV